MQHRPLNINQLKEANLGFLLTYIMYVYTFFLTENLVTRHTSACMEKNYAVVLLYLITQFLQVHIGNVLQAAVWKL